MPGRACQRRVGYRTEGWRLVATRAAVLGDEQGGGAVAERRVGDPGLGGTQGRGATPRRATGKRASERRSDPRKA
eukprot:1767791-Prymnesium_polylepis.1